MKYSDHFWPGVFVRIRVPERLTQWTPPPPPPAGVEVSRPRPHALVQQRTRQAVHLQEHRRRRDEGGDSSREPDLHLRRGRHPEDEGPPRPLQYSQQLSRHPVNPAPPPQRVQRDIRNWKRSWNTSCVFLTNRKWARGLLEFPAAVH